MADTVGLPYSSNYRQLDWLTVLIMATQSCGIPRVLANLKSGPMQRANAVTGPDHNAKEIAHG